MDCDFIERLHRINLIKEEGEVCQVKATRRKEILEECLLSLLGRFLSTQPYNQRAAKSLLKMVWKLRSDLRIIDVGEGLFQFKFTLESQLKWVINNGPWRSSFSTPKMGTRYDSSFSDLPNDSNVDSDLGLTI